VGIDLAKNVFSVHGVDPCGKVVVGRTIGRGKLLTLVAQLPPCVIGLEACSGAHEWARQFRQLGHDARLMAPKFVTPYRKSGKNDGNDAEAIYEAVSRPSMRFVPVKSIEHASAGQSEPARSSQCARSARVKPFHQRMPRQASAGAAGSVGAGR
jgi:transposase